MATYTQANRPMALTTPLGPDALLLVGLSGREAISQLYHFQLDLIAPNEQNIAFDQLLGQKVSAALELADGSKRYFGGICSRLSQGARDVDFTAYRMEVVPQSWFLTRVAQSRIFQQMTVPEILKQVLNGLDVDYQIQGNFSSRDYCVQYRETDFNFASRLMEEEGIFYFFKHTAGSSQMILANTPQAHPDLGSFIFDEVRGGTRDEDRIFSWEKAQELRSGKYTLWDHCFELPHKHLDADKTIQDSVAAGTVNHKLKLNNSDKLELYDYPGEYAQRFDGINPGGGDRSGDLAHIFEDNTRTVGIRMQEVAADGLVIHGAGNLGNFTSGSKFSLQRHYNADGSYILTSIQHAARLGDNYATDVGGEQGGMHYSNSFTSIPSGLPFRPARTTPKPFVQGTQTAVVVGPAGEEIFPDKYSRVKVQFHWDRQGKNDINSSCWIRVGSPWAGKNWGMISIPRIGQEVIVAFEEGDPDRPIIIGSVYNADMMPPYTLPDNKTRSTWKSRSTLNGTPENFNELRFEDKKGSEEVYFHAEKDFNRVVENNDTHKVGFDKKDKGDQTIQIFNNQSLTVGCPQASDGSQTISVYHNRTETVETGDETVTIKQGNRSIFVNTGNDLHQVKMGNRDVKIDMGNDTLTISMGNQSTKISMGKSTTEAMQSIELVVGQSSIKVDQMGVTIKGMMVSIEGQIQTAVKGMMTQVNGDAMLQMKGGITMIN